MFSFLRDSYQKLLDCLKPGFKPPSHIPHIHYGTSHLFISGVEPSLTSSSSLQASESATVVSNTGNVRLILDFGFPQWPSSQRGMTYTDLTWGNSS